MAGDPGDAPEVGEGGIRSVLTMGSLVDPSGNEVISFSFVSAHVLHLLRLSVSLALCFLLLLVVIWLLSRYSKVRHCSFP